MNDTAEIMFGLTTMAIVALYFILNLSVTLYILYSIDAHILAWIAYILSVILFVIISLLNIVLGDDF